MVERSEGLGCQLVSNSMSRNSFLSIKKYIHFADNQKLVQGNKVAKILPLYNLFNSSIVKFGVFHQNLSIDESMVPYYGKHGAKMFIRGKPIRFGYKIWALCGSNGYPYHLQIYQGKEAGRPSQPLGSRVINDLVDVVLENSSPSFHRFYFDNFIPCCSPFRSDVDEEFCYNYLVTDAIEELIHSDSIGWFAHIQQDAYALQVREDYIVSFHSTTVILHA